MNSVTLFIGMHCHFNLLDMPGDVAHIIYHHGHPSIASLYVYRMSRQRQKRMTTRLRIFCTMMTFDDLDDYPESDEYGSEIESSDNTP
jgi:hypothetical protein